VSIHLLKLFGHIYLLVKTVILFLLSSHSNDSVLEELNSSLMYIKQKYPHAHIRDFNSPGTDWEHGTLTESYISCQSNQKLITLSHDSHMSQLVTFSTRAQNTLDLLFTSHPDIIMLSTSRAK